MHSLARARVSSMKCKGGLSIKMAWFDESGSLLIPIPSVSEGWGPQQCSACHCIMNIERLT